MGLQNDNPQGIIIHTQGLKDYRLVEILRLTGFPVFLYFLPSAPATHAPTCQYVLGIRAARSGARSPENKDNISQTETTNSCHRRRSFSTVQYSCWRYLNPLMPMIYSPNLQFTE